MDRRTVAGTFCAATFTSGAAALIGATAVPAGSSYFAVLGYAGVAGVVIGLIGIALLLVLPAPVHQPVPAGAPPDEGPPADLDSKGRALWLLKRARTGAAIARKQWGSEAARRSYHEIVAAMLAVEKEFGCGGRLKIHAGSDEPTYKDMLGGYIAFADALLPLLEAGHIDAARRASASFSFTRGWG